MVRVGKDNDGGYVIADIEKPKYDFLISCGISNDISFEKQFLDSHPDISCVAFDGTIDALPEKNPRITFIKKNIGATNSDKTDNLNYYLNTYKNIMLKMDIEGSEHQWIKTVDKKAMENILQIVIEMHYNNDGHNDFESMKKIAQTHYLIHVHGNNCCGMTTIDGITMPAVVECTYLRKKDFDLTKKTSFTMPTKLDQPNRKGKTEINLTI